MARLHRLLAARLTLVSIALLGASIAAAPSTALALKPAERKATTIKAIDGASTAKAAFAEIRFRGQIADKLGTKGLRNAQVTIKFVPASGRATVITESGPTDEPEKRRRGTKGPSEILRDGRTMLVLVRNLPGPVAKVVVKTSLPRKKLDKQRAQLRVPATEEAFELELEHIDRLMAKAQTRAAKAVIAADVTTERIAEAKRALRRKRTRDQARKRLERLKPKLAELKETQETARARFAFLGRWVTLLEGGLRPLAVRECNDGMDNGDPEDSLADFGFDKDPGCIMRPDNDEQDVPMPLTCPAPGKSATAVGTITTPQTNTYERFIVSLPPPEPDKPRLAIVDQVVAGASGGPYPLDTAVTQLCNYEFDFVYGYVVTTSGAPSGSYSLRVAVTVENNGGYPGGAQLQMRLAAGTSR